MPTFDSQVHAYERNHPGRPWAGTLHGPAEVTGDQMVAAMNAVGVDGAVLVSPFSMYRYDASYALAVYAAHPTRFRLVKPVDPADPAVADRIAEWASTKGTVGIRLMLRGEVSPDPTDPGLNRVLVAAARHSLPVNVLCWGRLEQIAGMAAQNPNTRLVIDHLGLQQPFEPPPSAEPFADLEKVLALAAHDSIAIKISGACTLSHEAFPYKDIWDPLGRIFDAFGFDRCMWGTDWTQAVALLTYEQGVEAFRVTDRLSDSDRAQLMGETLHRIYKWSRALPPDPGPAREIGRALDIGEQHGDGLALAFEIFSGGGARLLLATSANLERLGWACCHRGLHPLFRGRRRIDHKLAMLDPEDLWKRLHAVDGMDADFGIPIDLQRHCSLQNAIVVRFSSTFGIIAIPRSIPESLCNDRLIRTGANSPDGIPAAASGSRPA